MINVQLIDHMGSDLTVVNAARVSFNKESEWTLESDDGDIHYDEPRLSDRDTKLIQFLARGMTADDFDEFVTEVAEMGLCHIDECYSDETKADLIKLLEKYRDTPEHWSPFAHPQASFRVSAPIFVARQLQKHTVGFAWNEVSRRYVDAAPTFYTPEVWRKRAENVKQGSSDEAVPYNEGWKVEYTRWMKALHLFYNDLLKAGVCPEQARMVLPQSMMTEWIWTGSLYAFARVCKLRLDSHTQQETQQVAKLISTEMARLFPVSWKALVNDDR